MSALLADFPFYGSYQVLGNLTVDLGQLEDFHGYKRSLDLQSGVYMDEFAAGNASIQRYGLSLRMKGIG